MEQMIKLFQVVLYLGMYSSILIILILLMKRVFGKLISPRWHYYIWVLLLMRLLIPITPESTLSAANLLNVTAKQVGLSIVSLSDYTMQVFHNANTDDFKTVGEPLLQSNTVNHLDKLNPGESGNNLNESGLATSGTNDSAKHTSAMRVIFFLWLTGMGILILYTLYINIIFAVKVRKDYKPLDNPRINDILRECLHIVGIKHDITLLTTNRSRTPSLYVSLQTSILVSQAQLEQLSDQEIKYIFLHELSHEKRKDIVVNWILSLLQIVYFFNPLIWVAFHRIHEDCEISCDAQALRYLKEEEYKSYGNTVIKLIKLNSESNLIPTTAGLWKNKSNYRRRITMISNFKKSNWLATLLTIVLILMVGMIGLTGCKKASEDTMNNSTVSPSVTEDTNPTATVTVTPVTNTPTPSVTKAPAESEVSTQNNLNQLTGLLGLSKDELTNKLGKDYEKVDEGGLEFKNPEVRVWFDQNGNVNQVYTGSSMIDFNGVKIGDSVEKFIEVFGKPVRQDNGVTALQTDNCLLEVYYDGDEEKTYAVYVLTQNEASHTPATEAPSKLVPRAESSSGNTFVFRTPTQRSTASKASADRASMSVSEPAAVLRNN